MQINKQVSKQTKTSKLANNTNKQTANHCTPNHSVRGKLIHLIRKMFTYEWNMAKS